MAVDKKKVNSTKTAAPKKSTAAKKAAAKKVEASKDSAPKTRMPARVVIALISIALFLVFLVMSLNPEGALVMLLMNITHGLIGKISFYIAIPALLYLFVIQAFSGKRPVVMRSICLMAFVLLFCLVACSSKDVLEVKQKQYTKAL